MMEQVEKIREVYDALSSKRKKQVCKDLLMAFPGKRKRTVLDSWIWNRDLPEEHVEPVLKIVEDQRKANIKDLEKVGV